jgi:nicotinamidase-related amidase
MASKLNGATFAASGKLELLNPSNCCVVLIDHQPAMTFGVANIDKQLLINNTVGLAKAAKIFHIPVILTSVESKSFSGAIWPQLTSLFPDQKPIERSSMNSWEDEALVAAVKKTGRKKLVMAALWTEVCLAFPALCAMQEGYEVYAVEDCCGGTSVVAHDAAIARIAQAGAVRATWISTMLEWQRDWARRATYDPVMQTVLEHGGVYGQAVEYCYTMVHKAPNFLDRLAAGKH